MMTCDELLRVVDPYLDGELSVFETLRVHGHLLTCAACRTILESESGLHALLEADVLEDEPPPDLQNRVLGSIGGTSPARPSPDSGSKWWLPGRVLLTGASLIALLLVTVLAVRLWRPQDVPPFALEAAGKHRLYAEGATPALDVTTGDVRSLTEWLGRQVGFPVKAPPAREPQERLVGGRTTSVADAPAAYLLYEWRGHPLSLLVSALQRDAEPERVERHVGGMELYAMNVAGLTVVWWPDGGKLYTAVSRSRMPDLEAFALLCARGRRVTSSPPRETSP